MQWERIVIESSIGWSNEVNFQLWCELGSFCSDSGRYTPLMHTSILKYFVLHIIIIIHNNGY